MSEEKIKYLAEYCRKTGRIPIEEDEELSLLFDELKEDEETEE